MFLGAAAAHGVEMNLSVLREGVGGGSVCLLVVLMSVGVVYVVNGDQVCCAFLQKICGREDTAAISDIYIYRQINRSPLWVGEREQWLICTTGGGVLNGVM